ncbi:MAG: aldehyde dehydrogenase family protein [Bacteroidia bacterium]|nr:aldehyde dehydrogenase family protein [Bacteroidia bacterium]
MAKTKTTANGADTSNAENGAYLRLDVQKTYKLYIGGKFPRTESGRFYKAEGPDGKLIANLCQASRKDFRDAVVVARNAQPGWAARSAYNRGQIIYRMAEMLEGRKTQFEAELIALGHKPAEAQTEVETTIDRLVYYAGWTDKYSQIFSSVNPVDSSHFNFSVPEPMGVISILAPEKPGFLGLISAIIPAVAGGNTVIVLASNTAATAAISFAEVLQTSDLPGGVINILTGFQKELISHFSSHKDVNALIYCDPEQAILTSIRERAAENLKRVLTWNPEDWFSKEAQGPYFIMDTQEIKTTWHPVGQ